MPRSRPASCRIAHANDGGGSIRVPASANGLVGLKTTRGRNPLGPDLGDMMGGLVCDGVVTRSVRDTAAALDATAGNEMGDPYWAPPKPKSYLDECQTPPGKLKIAFATQSLFGKKFDPECVTAIQTTAKLLQSLGHHVEEASPTVAVDMLMQSFMPVWASGLAMLIDGTAMMTGRTAHESDFQGMTWGLYQMGKQITASQYQMCWFQLQAISRQVAHVSRNLRCLDDNDLGRPAGAQRHVRLPRKGPDQGLRADHRLPAGDGNSKRNRPACDLAALALGARTACPSACISPAVSATKPRY